MEKQMRILWKTPKVNVSEKKKKKLYHTIVTQFCKFGGDPIDYWKYADNWDENQKLVAIDFNNRYGFIKSHLVEMELVKVYKK